MPVFCYTAPPAPPRPRDLPSWISSLQHRFNQNEGGDGHCFTYFILFKRAALRVVICGALSFLNQRKSSFIIQVTSCLLNALKYSFKYLLLWQECRDAPLLHQWHTSQSISAIFVKLLLCRAALILYGNVLFSSQQFFSWFTGQSQHFSHTKKLQLFFSKTSNNPLLWPKLFTTNWKQQAFSFCHELK